MLLSLALTLLVARVLADDVDLAVATNDLALVAHLLYRRAYLHRLSFPVLLILTDNVLWRDRWSCLTLSNRPAAGVNN